MTTAELVEKRNHHAAIACELLLNGDHGRAQHHARQRRRYAQLINAQLTHDRKAPT